MTIAGTSFSHALAVLLLLNRKPPIVPGYDNLWGAAINEGLVIC